MGLLFCLLSLISRPFPDQALALPHRGTETPRYPLRETGAFTPKEKPAYRPSRRFHSASWASMSALPSSSIASCSAFVVGAGYILRIFTRYLPPRRFFARPNSDETCHTPSSAQTATGMGLRVIKRLNPAA